MKYIIPLVFAGVFANAAFVPTVAVARPNVVVVREAPPPPRAERVPAARRGYEWIPGHWDWNGRRYIWVAGRHEKIRAGHVYQRTEWRKGPDGWYQERGGWREDARGRGRDKDRDGVRDRADARPNNPNRY